MLNKVQLQGRLTADPELKTTQSGTPVTAFTIAVDRDYSKDKEADFINIVAWKQKAEFVTRYFGKGKMIIVDGRLQVRKYQANDGSNRYVTEVIADNVHFAGDKTESREQPVYMDSPEFEEVTGDDELPF